MMKINKTSSTNNNNSNRIKMVNSNNGKEDSSNSKTNGVNKIKCNKTNLAQEVVMECKDNKFSSSKFKSNSLPLQFKLLFRSVSLQVDLNQEQRQQNSFQRVKLLSLLSNSQIHLMHQMNQSRRREVKERKERRVRLLFNQQLRLKKKSTCLLHTEENHQPFSL